MSLPNLPTSVLGVYRAPVCAPSPSRDPGPGDGETWRHDFLRGVMRATWCGTLGHRREGRLHWTKGRWRCGSSWCYACEPVRGAMRSMASLDAWRGLGDPLMVTFTAARPVPLHGGAEFFDVVAATAKATGLPWVLVAECTPRAGGGEPCPLCVRPDGVEVSPALRAIAGAGCLVCGGTGEVGAGHLHVHGVTRAPSFQWGATDPLRTLWRIFAGNRGGNLDYQASPPGEEGEALRAYAASLYAAGLGKSAFFAHIRQRADLHAYGIARRVRKVGPNDGVDIGDIGAVELSSGGFSFERQPAARAVTLSARAASRLDAYAQVRGEPRPELGVPVGPLEGDGASGLDREQGRALARAQESHRPVLDLWLRNVATARAATAAALLALASEAPASVACETDFFGEWVKGDLQVDRASSGRGRARVRLGRVTALDVSKPAK